MKHFIAVAFFILCTAPAIAQTTDSKAPDTYAGVNDIPPILRSQLLNSSYREAYLAQLLAPLRRAAKDNLTLRQADLDQMVKSRLENSKRQKVQSILAYDSDLDGVATREEIEKKITEDNTARFSTRSPMRALDNNQPNEAIQRQLNSVMQSDSDGDGKITVQEASASVDTNDNMIRNHDQQLIDYLALAPSVDKGLSADTLEALGRKAFATVDKNNNGMIDKDEVQALLPVRAARAMERAHRNCTLPKAGAGEALHVITAYEGATASNVAIAGQATETSSIEINIPKGDGHIFLVVAAQTPVIWDIKGATERVSQLAILGSEEYDRSTGGPKPDAKITAAAHGISKDKVSFHSSSACRISYTRNRGENGAPNQSLAQAAKLYSLTGVEAASVDTAYEAYSFTLGAKNGAVADKPSTPPPPPQGYDAATWQNHLRFAPGGLAQFDVAAIVADASVEKYVVPPAWAGMAKLVGAGAIVPSRASDNPALMISDNQGNSTVISGVENAVIGKGMRVRHSPSYKIVKDIGYFPSGMSGALSTNFIVAKGVKMPQGSPQHSRVSCEDQHDCIKGYSYTPAKAHNPACISLAACVDGTDFFKIRGGKLTHEHGNFSQIGTHPSCPPGTAVSENSSNNGIFFIDGKATPSGSVSDVRIQSFDTINVIKGDAGAVTVAAPGLLQVNDTGGGAKLYEIDLCPAAATLPAPAASTGAPQ